MLGNTILTAIMCGITAYATMKIFKSGYEMGKNDDELIKNEEKVISSVEPNQKEVVIENEVLEEWFKRG